MARSKAAKRCSTGTVNTSITKSGGRSKRKTANQRRISDSSFNVSAISRSMVSTPKVGSKRWRKTIAAAAKKSGCRQVSKKGVKRKSMSDSRGSTAEADQSSPQAFVPDPHSIAVMIRI
jgi:hypothetical protein